MIVRTEAPDDRDAVRAVLLSAFPTLAEADLVEALRLAGDTVASLVAVVEGHVVGCAVLSTVSAPFRSLALAPVAVVPAHQS